MELLELTQPWIGHPAQNLTFLEINFIFKWSFYIYKIYYLIYMHKINYLIKYVNIVYEKLSKIVKETDLI